MKTVVGISLGSSKQDFEFSTRFLGQRLAVKRAGTEGRIARALELVKQWDDQARAGDDRHAAGRHPAGRARPLLRQRARAVLQRHGQPQARADHVGVHREPAFRRPGAAAGRAQAARVGRRAAAVCQRHAPGGRLGAAAAGAVAPAGAAPQRRADGDRRCAGDRRPRDRAGPAARDDRRDAAPAAAAADRRGRPARDPGRVAARAAHPVPEWLQVRQSLRVRDPSAVAGVLQGRQAGRNPVAGLAAVVHGHAGEVAGVRAIVRLLDGHRDREPHRRRGRGLADQRRRHAPRDHEPPARVPLQAAAPPRRPRCSHSRNRS